jgi:hypothetical protein
VNDKDSILVAVAAAVIFGHGQPCSNQSIPVGGYAVQPVAESVMHVGFLINNVYFYFIRTKPDYYGHPRVEDGKACGY